MKQVEITAEGLEELYKYASKKFPYVETDIIVSVVNDACINTKTFDIAYIKRLIGLRVIDAIRNNHYRLISQCVGLTDPDLSWQSQDRWLTNTADSVDLSQYLDMLPADEKQLIVDIYYNDISPSEIAKKLHVTPPAIFIKRGRILKKIKRIMEAYES